ncbi:MAG: hypothetical protein GY926_09110 [bacterium]|nr:hypothetical protein [bacterium]
MSVQLQSVPENEAGDDTPAEESAVSQAKHEAAEIVARARREAEAIVAEARSGSVASSPLAALGDNAEEIIGQVRKLIKKQRQLQAERIEMTSEIESLKSERDELVHRLTDAVERMEELAEAAHDGPLPQPQAAPPRPKPVVAPARAPEPPRQEKPEPKPQPRPEPAVAAEDTSLAARLKKAEAAEAAASGGEDTSLAARLKKAEEAEKSSDSRAARMAENERNIEAAVAAERASAEVDYDDEDPIANDGRSFYDRHSANLPRLEGDGGRSVLSAMGGMRPELETKGRKGRRRAKKGS